MSIGNTENIRYMLREGTSDSPFVFITEDIVIKNNKAQLKEVPSFFEHVAIPGFYEIMPNTYGQYIELKSDEFWVDYNIGVIYFNEAQEGKTIKNVYYKGTGLVLYPSNRIFLHNDNPSVIETLQDFIEEMLTNTIEFTKILVDFRFKEQYNSNVDYKKYNVVNYEPEKSVYICDADCKGVLPTDKSHWTRIISVKNEAEYAKIQGDYAKQQGDYAKLEGDYAKEQGDITKQATIDARKATSNYTEITEQTKKIYKPGVATYNNISSTYPNPQIGWTVRTNDTHIEYRWDGFEWVNLGVGDAYDGFNITISGNKPTNSNTLWLDVQKATATTRIKVSKTSPSNNLLWLDTSTN